VVELVSRPASGEDDPSEVLSGRFKVKRIVEFTHSVRVIDSGDGQVNLKTIQVANIWPEGAPKRGKPQVRLMGEDFPALLKCIELWDADGQPDMEEIKRRAAKDAEKALAVVQGQEDGATL
jgi:hypothetical protein